ncbi:MAG: hypothetical protein R6V60_05285 [Desulfobacterales bacterium]
MAEFFNGLTPQRQVQAPLSQPYVENIRQWVEQGIQVTTIYQALVTQFGFAGNYSSIRRRVRKIRGKTPKATCMLDFAPARRPRWTLAGAPRSPRFSPAR